MVEYRPPYTSGNMFQERRRHRHLLADQLVERGIVQGIRQLVAATRRVTR